MKREKLSLRSKIGLSLLAPVLIYWIAIPILPFLDIPYKAATIAAVIVGGEILFGIAVAVLGVEYWGQIKSGTFRLLAWKGHRRVVSEQRPEWADDGRGKMSG